jgi:hypothetical protein
MPSGGGHIINAPQDLKNNHCTGIDTQEKVDQYQRQIGQMTMKTPLGTVTTNGCLVGIVMFTEDSRDQGPTYASTHAI